MPSIKPPDVPHARMRRLACALLACGAAAALAAPPATADEIVFSFTGAPQTWTVPPGVTSARFALVGGGGGASGGVHFGSAPGGRGGVVRATLALVPGEQLAIYVGGAAPGRGDQRGGWNGGGGHHVVGNIFSLLGGGGGASDVRVGGTGLADRVLVAGGGGGGGSYGAGPGPSNSGGVAGGAGGDAGQDGAAGIDLPPSETAGGGGRAPPASGDAGGAGGTAGASSSSSQGVAGSAGAFGEGAPGNYGHAGSGGGGGGGWYGGGSGGTGGWNDSALLSAGAGGGGGGSSYASPAATDVSFDIAPAVTDGVVRIEYAPPPTVEHGPTVSGDPRVGATLTCAPAGGGRRSG